MNGEWFSALILLGLPWCFIALLAFKPRFVRTEHLGRWLWLVPATLFGLMAWQLLGTPQWHASSVTLLDWLPEKGIRLSFQFDGLSLFFGMVVTGMGTLIFIYTAGYFSDDRAQLRKFYSFLLLFMAAMVGTVFSGNLLTLYIWWEMTGVASFFLIGYLHETDASRRGARMALITTITTGLSLLAGILLVGLTAGTFEINELIERAHLYATDPRWVAGFVLMFIGACGKSAQFPFHYWLPNAMAAPTPVSAYLHSATMVKLGVFLVARIFPIFSQLDLWMPLLAFVGFTTFLLGATFSLLSNKLKGILAYSTVSQLGFLIGFYGISPSSGAHWDLLHILNHVFYKGALFMVVGIIDHSTHIKDIRDLGGLRRRMPLLFIITAISSASMAGVIFTSGFLSKEYMLKEKLDFLSESVFWNAFPLAAVILASVFKVAFSIRLVAHIFLGPENPKAVAHFHKPSLLIQLPPLLLTCLTLLTGALPFLMTGILQAFYTPGLHDTAPAKLKLWHGLTSTAFLISMSILLVGTALYFVSNKLQWRFTHIPNALRFDLGFDRMMDGLPGFGARVSRWLGVETPTAHVAIVLAVGCLWIGLPILTQWQPLLLPAFQYDTLIQPLIAALLILMASIALLLVHSWKAQVIFVGTIGFLVMFYFVIYRAPDLALTQVLVEAASLILLLVLILKFPSLRNDPRPLSKARKLTNFLIASTVGVLTFVMTLLFARDNTVAHLGSQYLEASLPLAKGTNAVNTILVDFRGVDTLLEIGVLTIATMGILGLLIRRKDKESTNA